MTGSLKRWCDHHHYNHQCLQHHDHHQKHHHHHHHQSQPDGVSLLVVSPTAPGFDPLCVSESSASDDLTVKVLIVNPNDDNHNNDNNENNDDVNNRSQAPQMT